VTEISKESAPQSVENEALRQLPSVDSFLSLSVVNELTELYGRSLVVDGTRLVLDRWRSLLINSDSAAPSDSQLVEELEALLVAQLSPSLLPVINATGVIIHTNLGRAPLSNGAREYVNKIAKEYSTLEYNLRQGLRGSRSIHAEDLLVKLTGAEAALVVNNNAAAVLLMLTALCRDEDVIISRGQLIEIGGGFRIPDVLRQSGARLVEIGTTNKTHLRDYQEAINEETGAILVAHHSNFKVVGFTSEPTLKELSGLSKSAGVPLFYDQGSGTLFDLSPYGLDKELTVKEAIEDGADLVAFSGDKLLGGPQAGILCGRKHLISTISQHPLARAVRADKMCLSALSRTLQSFLTGRATEEIPVWQMISKSLASIEEVAIAWASTLNQKGVLAEVVDGVSTVGGGSLPGSTLPTKMVAISTDQPDKLAATLRSGEPPIIGRISQDRLLLDPRTVLSDQEGELIRALLNSVGGN